MAPTGTGGTSTPAPAQDLRAARAITRPAVTIVDAGHERQQDAKPAGRGRARAARAPACSNSRSEHRVDLERPQAQVRAVWPVAAARLLPGFGSNVRIVTSPGSARKEVAIDLRPDAPPPALSPSAASRNSDRKRPMPSAPARKASAASSRQLEVRVQPHGVPVCRGQPPAARRPARTTTDGARRAPEQPLALGRRGFDQHVARRRRR